MGWIGRYQHGRFYRVSCETVVLSGLFAFLAILISILFIPSIFLSLEFLLVCFAMDSMLIMVWAIWKLVYRKGEQYL